jgi:uncharacterized protein with LGFP repeats/glucose/arabinose dehydrogenase
MPASRLRLVIAAFAAVLMAALLSAAVPAPQASAAPSLPPGFVLRDLPSGQSPFDLTDFAYLPGDDGGVLTIGKQGKVAWVAPDGHVNTLANLPEYTQNDVGLVGLTIATDYATSKQIYLARSVPVGSGFVVRVERWTVTGSPEPTGITGATTLVETPGDAPVHGTTGIVAAEDGTLWISIGDNADFVQLDTRALRALDVNAIQGKILHITKNGLGVPTNPFYDAANPGSVRSRVYASGFRSPFRLSLDPSTGTPIVGDVGWNTWEELDFVQPGRNYKWPCWEGNHPTPGYADLAACAGVTNTPPLWEYQHGGAVDQGNSVTAGFVYNGTSYPQAYRGAFFFGDYVGQKIWTMRYDGQGTLTQNPQNPPLFTNVGGPVKFAPAANGDVVFADINSGMLRRLSYLSGNTAPIAKATTTTNPDTRTVSFDGTGSYDFDGDSLSYRWDFGDGTSATGAHATHTYAAGPAQLTARLTVTDPLGASGITDIVVAPSNHSPVLQVQTPGDHTFAVNEPVTLNTGASASDAEDGPLDVHWTSSILHCPDEATCHMHPGVAGTGPMFTVPFTGHEDSRMVVTATVTDSMGVSTSVTYVAFPRQHRLTLLSDIPAALQIPSEGGVSTSLVTEGATIDVVAAATATDGGSTFANWTDGTPSRTRTLTVGTSDLTLSAHYLSPIEQRYQSDTALRQLLGQPTGAEVLDDTVRYRDYTGGRLYWSKAAGTHEMHGGILARYLQLGGHHTFGTPTTDESSTADGAGRFNHLAWAPATLWSSIYWRPGNDAHAVWGSIHDKWMALGWETGPLGYPDTDELSTPDGIGRFNHFSKSSSIYWTPQTDAHAIYGAIRARWSATGWETGPLGYPATDELSTPDGIGRFNHFSKTGSVYWTARTGAQDVYGAIRARWSAIGWERSYLGYPTSGEFGVAGGRRNNFQFGYIQWFASNGAVIDRRY